MAPSFKIGDARIIAPFLVLAVVLMLSITTHADTQGSIAATGPKNVRGYVEDSNHDPVQGANVTVMMRDSTHVVQTLYYDATESDGFYSVTFGPSDWNEGYTIVVDALFSPLSGSNSTIADSGALQYVNVTFSSAIPEFGSLLGSSYAGVVGLFLAVIIVTKRRQAKSA